MTRRLLTAACVLGLLATACSDAPEPGEVDLGEGRRFVPAVIDPLDNAGVSPAIAVDDEGVPYISYFSFPTDAEGDVPVTRPIFAPTVPGVLLASAANGVVTRGAVAMATGAPNGVSVPFGPATDKSLKALTPESVVGTAIARDDQGGLHVAWTDDGGLRYGSGGGTEAFAVDKLVLSYKETLGAPAITVGQDGVPWIAVAADGRVLIVEVGKSLAKGQGVTVARARGADTSRRVGIAATPDGPVVTYSDARRDTPVALSFDGRSWTPIDVEEGGGGLGLSMATDGEGVPSASYATAGGEVHVATLDGGYGGAWRVDTVAEGASAEQTATTGVALDDAGTTHVAWQATEGGVRIATDAEGSFAEVETPGTATGVTPALGAAPDGSAVLVAWRDPVEEDLLLGVLGDPAELVIAQPSPTTAVVPSAAASPAQGNGGGNQPATELTVAADTGAATNGFTDTDVLAKSGEELSVTFDNQDTVPHNWTLFANEDLTGDVLANTANITGTSETVRVDPLDPGKYGFQCTLHPTVMVGTLTAE